MAGAGVELFMTTDSGDTWDFISSAPDFYVAMTSLSDLTSFVQAAHEFLPYAASQQSIRVRAIINKENDPVTIGECEFELEEIDRRQKEVWPQIVWGSVLVSIYAAFEHGVEQAFKNWRLMFNTNPPFSQGRRQDFITAAEEYASTRINIPLFPDNVHRAAMMDLKALRKSYVHHGSRICSLSKHMQAKMAKGQYVGCSIIGEGEEAKWIASAHTCLNYILGARTTIRIFGEKAFDMYDELKQHGRT